MRRKTLVAAGALALGGLAIGSAVQAVSPGFTDDRSATLAKAISPEKPRNVILLIGDGTDDSIITAARNYELGAKGRFALDELPFTGAMTTFGLKTGTDPNDYPINYVSDSAPTASGWSTGKKTVDSRISQGPSASDTAPGTDYDTVLEKYKAAGKRTGNVSTAEITDATPAAAGSHINLRECQGPANMAKCGYAKKSAVPAGKGSIAEQLVDNKIDVLLGGGAARYAQATDAGPSVLDYAKSTYSYQAVDTKTALDGVTSLDKGPILGLFASANMTPRYEPLTATPAGAGGPTTTCKTADRGTQPSLADMTDKAIKLLDNDKGFFLQVESAMVDKQEHASDICGAIGDVLELDNALKVAQAYQAKHPDTLIIVTGDHAHSTQIVGNGGTTTDATGATGGKATATVKTFDGDPMTVAYSTAAPGSSQSHTGSQIRVAASGPQAANVTGTIDQTDLFSTMLGRTPSKLPTTTPPTAQPTPQQPAPAGAPVVAVVTDKKISAKTLTKKGLRVSTSAGGATSVRITVVKGGRTLATKTLGARGGTAEIRVKTRVKGALKVVVTATGPGGTATKARSVTVTR
ncbi:alkaline phosphatase [Aeromicrobium fastidiosum]|uniref:Alkaline phosphatase n=1 Tax=Aeromicrobium fastidiosum TaxID=52699 RepID=A0A641AML4_9ACTN|nr:alkaline phosphatase [Aeromicrobium fastidiosum]KAA1376042.1 alkaline phosphatase [Aeromicrobium fastidiosum]MBP2392088.1 alkaline phosphatase [Aeromicrobium fastidiosum]